MIKIKWKNNNQIMTEAPYVENIDATTLYRNLIFLGIAITISLISLSYAWLKSSFMTIKTRKKEVKTSNPFMFLYLMIKITWNLDDQDFWLANLTLEGYTYILFLVMQIRILFYYLVIVYFSIGVLELWKFFLSLNGDESQHHIYL